MQELFEKFSDNIKLTASQRIDAETKYNGVCKKMHSHYYESEYDGVSKLIFGSYSKSKNTAIRPISEDQDVDVLFKLPKDIFAKYVEYKSNGQSALLQAVRDIFIGSMYSLSEKPKAWGKVILIKTADGAHNIELLPALENEDGTFIIPNTENGGSWDFFDPRSELKKFQLSNDKSDGLTGRLSRMIKRWSREVVSSTLKSFEIENHVMIFLDHYQYVNKPYSQIIVDFFDHLLSNVDLYNRSFVETAHLRAKKALGYEHEAKFAEAVIEWKKVFGDSSFPSYNDKKEMDLDEQIRFLEQRFPSNDEEFLTDKYGIKLELNSLYKIDLNVEIDQQGFRSHFWLLTEFKQRAFRIHKKAQLRFFIGKHNVPFPFIVKWKVRNFGIEAQSLSKLRGDISEDDGSFSKKETTLYHGEHYVQCYVIKDNKCVVIGKILVPIQ